jgi:uncharacterized protein (TIGR03435 family)
MKQTGKSVFVAAMFTVALVPAFSHTPQAQKPSFDVVSIKSSGPNPPANRGGGARGNRYSVSSIPLRSLLMTAYGQASLGNVPPGQPIGQMQIIGGPGWIDFGRWDIQATMDCSNGPVSREQFQLMLQAVLEDRFQLKAHVEDRELPVYNLVVNKDGPKIKLSADQTPNTLQATPAPYCVDPSSAPAAPRPALLLNANLRDPNFVLPRGMLIAVGSPNGSLVRGAAVSLANVITMLQFQIGRPVVDKTNLTGLFDLTLQISEDAAETGAGTGASGAAAGPAAADPGGSIFSAFEELGLKFESAKAPVPVLVIDSVQKPKEN